MSHESGFGGTPTEVTPPHFNERGQFKELHYFRNPVSSTANHPRVHPDRFRNTFDLHGLKVYEHTTSIEPGETIENIKNVLDEDVVLAVSSGDGGSGELLARIIDAKILQPDLQNLDPPVLLVPAGNKNDLASTVHNKKSFNNPELALIRGTSRSVSPLEVTRYSQSENRTHYSRDFAYTTFGISGDTSAQVSSPHYRSQRMLDVPGGRFLAERWQATRSYLRAEQFEINANPGTYQEETYDAFELMFANGPNMAGTLHPDVSLFEAKARIIEVRNRLMGFATLGALSCGRPVGELHSRQDGPKTYDLIVSPDTVIWGQGNGEAYPLVEGRHRLTMRISQMSVSLLTTVV